MESLESLRTNNGVDVIIYAENMGSGTHTIHGAYRAGDAYYVAAWTNSGHYVNSDHPSPLDIDVALEKRRTEYSLQT